jgi:peroxiredoxin
MLADGQADYTKKLARGRDMTGRGWGIRSRRYSMLVEDGVVKAVNVAEPGKFEVSSAEASLGKL